MDTRLKAVSDNLNKIGATVDAEEIQLGKLQTDATQLETDLQTLISNSSGKPIPAADLQALADQAGALADRLGTSQQNLAGIDTGVLTSDAAVKAAGAPPPVALTISPASFALGLTGATQQLQVLDSTGADVTAGSTFAAKDATMISVDASGLVTALVDNPVTAVSATNGGTTVSASINGGAFAPVGLPTGPQTVPGIAGTVSPQAAALLRSKTGLTT